ncbi:MAG: hypothetical protein GY828_07725, partial [Candidatus Gracilibacteria bacterium]|nr:hypothetical protein [Candidatus Gracilibacteria bacterium]
MALKHENIHTCYGAFVDQGMIGFTWIENAIERYISIKNMDAGDFLVEMMLNGVYSKISSFIDSSQGEIIANFEGLLKGEISTELISYKEL